ncbi:MAG: hypothetical protein AAFP90_17120, partial [Planctomycetota bacterium]
LPDPAASPQHRHKTVYLTGSVAAANETVYPTAVGLARLVINGENKVAYLNAPKNEYVMGTGDGAVIYTGDGAVIYTGVGRLKAGIQEFTMRPETVYEEGWEFDENISVGGGFGGFPGSIYAQPELTGQLESDESSHAGVVANHPILPTSCTGNSGVTEYQTHDSNNHKTRIRDSDGEFDAYAYDANGNVIRHRDPEGNVTRYAYNNDGKITTIQNGLHDGPSNPPGTSAGNYNDNPNDEPQTTSYGQTTYEYFPANAAGRILLSKVIDPLGNETMFIYDALGKMTSQTLPPANTSGQPRTTTYTYNNTGRIETVTPPWAMSRNSSTTLAGT